MVVNGLLPNDNSIYNHPNYLHFKIIDNYIHYAKILIEKIIKDFFWDKKEWNNIMKKITVNRLAVAVLCAALNVTTVKAVDVSDFSAFKSAITSATEITLLNDLTATSGIGNLGQTTLTIYGGGYSIDGVNAYGGFNVVSGRTLTLNEITINNFTTSSSGAAIYSLGNLNVNTGIFKSNSADLNGGAIYSTGSFTIDSSEFTSNTTVRDGGAIYATGSGTKNITNSTFTENTTTGTAITIANNNGGGAIWNGSGVMNITNSDFYNNVTNISPSNSGGGAIANSSGTLNIIGGIFDSNKSTSQGGAIYSLYGTLNISGGTSFTENIAASTGGAITLLGGAGNVITIDNASFSLNKAGISGGAISTQGTLKINQGSFDQNTATGSGGAIYASQAITITDSSFTNNSGGSGGAISSTAGINISSIDTRNIFTNNTAASGGAIGVGGASTSTISGSDFISNTATTTASPNGGGAINNTSTLTLTDNTFTENTSKADGGAIYNNGSLKIKDNTFTGNTTTNRGGGIFSHSSGIITIDNTTFDGNKAGTSAGALYSYGDTTITGSTFKNNVAQNGAGGAVNNDAHGSTLTLTVIDSIFDKNTANGGNGAGGAIYNGVGNIAVTGSTFTNNTAYANGGAIYNIVGRTTTINGGTTFENNSVTAAVGNGGAIYNAGTLVLNSDLSDITFTDNTAHGVDNDIYNTGTTNINGTANSVIINSGIAGIGTINKSNDGILELNGNSSGYTGIYNQTGGQTIVSDKFFNGISNIQEGILEFAQGSEFAANTAIKLAAGTEFNITSNDNFTISSTNFDGYSGTYGDINKSGSGELTITGDKSGFESYTQTAGITTVTSEGKMFGGVNTIIDSTLNVTGESFYYNATLGNNAVLNHYASTVNGGTISSASNNLIFDGNNTTANFSSVTGLTSQVNYILADKIDNGSTNTLTFDNSIVKLGSTDYTGTTIYNFNNSIIDLTTNSAISNTIFDYLTLNNAQLNFDIAFVNTSPNVYELQTDTLTVNNPTAGQTVGVNMIKVLDDSDNGLAGSYQATVLDGLTFSNGIVIDAIATTAYQYDVTLSGTDIHLTAHQASDELSLNRMNILNGSRGFNFSFLDSDAQTYNIGASLAPTANGTLVVQGYDSDPAHSILSGAIVDSSGILIGTNGSFFDLAGTTDFTLKNLTIQDAFKTGNGSILSVTGTGSQAFLQNLIVQNNEATGYGGAVYQSDGNLNIESVQFLNNKAAYGGAIAFTGGTSPTSATINAQFTNNEATADGGAIYNSASNIKIHGTTLFEGNNAGGLGGAIYNAGEISLDSSGGNILFSNNSDSTGANDIYTSAGSTLNINGNSNTVGIDGGISGTGSIFKSNDGELLLSSNSDNSAFTGTFNQSGGTTTVAGKFFGNVNTIDGGTLNWFGGNDSKSAASELIINGGSLNIGGTYNGNSVSGYLKLNNTNDVIASGTLVNIAANSILENLLGNVTLDTNCTLDGALLNSSTVTLDGFIMNSAAGIYQQTGSTSILNMENGSYLTLGSQAILSEGSVNIGNGTTGSTLEVSTGSIIANAITVNLDLDNTILISGGQLEISTGDTLAGKIQLTGGNFIFNDLTANGKIIATGGTLFVESGALQAATDSLISSDTQTLINSGAQLDITGGDVTLNSDSIWNGTVNLDSGKFTLNSYNNASGNINQAGGTFTLENNTNYVMGSETNITGGNLDVTTGSNLILTASSDLSRVSNLSINSDSSLYSMGNSFNINGSLFMDQGTVYSMDGAFTTNTAQSLNVGSGGALFTVDFDAVNMTSDKYIFDSINGTGNITIIDWSLPLGQIPQGSHIVFHVFEATNINIDDIQFKATDKEYLSPVGRYVLSSEGGGYYSLNLVGLNSQSLRGQVAAMATYNNQLLVNNALFDHVYFDSEIFSTNNKNDNRYAIVSSTFAPYQYKREEGSLWYKNYAAFERLSMTNNLNVGNNTYGSIIGADFPAMKLKKGWEFIPTAYVSYNGGHQTFNGVGMYQNGGQGGFMGTFMKGDFISSILAYGGGYHNEMSVQGFKDNTGNWFAGTAMKNAYNFHPTKHFTIQPTALVSYNIFGKQNWGTDFGGFSMTSGYLNGINVAPGLNFIYGRESWSLYLTTQYMYNINDGVSGSIGNINLPKVSMRHGYFEYGIGTTKTWKDQLMGYAQVTMRNGGRTGVGFQLGLNYKFGLRDKKQEKL